MFNTPTITKNLLIINVLAFVATLVFPSLGDLGGLHFFLASDFHVYQLFTYMFLHANFTHILFNMFALWMFGRVMESVWGPKKFLFYYISCGIGAGLMQEIAQFVQFYLIMKGEFPMGSIADIFEIGKYNAMFLNAWTTVGASGAIYAILLAFGMTFPNERIFIFPLPLPIKAKWFVIFYAAIELLSAVTASGDGVAHMAHLGGMLFGFLMIRYWQRHPGAYYSRSNGAQFFESLKNKFDQYREKYDRGGQGSHGGPQGGATRHETNWEYNAKKKANQDEIDRILDKIRKSGYDSLTKEEKQKLFDSSNND